MDRLRKEGAELVYRCAKQHSEPGSGKRGAKADELHLTPLELIARIAALVPPPRTHRHRYFGVLAPNSPLRAAVTALAAPVQQATAEPAQTGTGEGAPGAAKLLRRVQFHYTPKHASWLNMAEIEIGILSRQCMDRRIASREVLQSEVDA